MTDWPTGWRDVVLRDSGIPKTQFALDALTAWERSTPTDTWTNNPLGMPYVKGVSVPAAFTSYAAFGTMADFYGAIKRHLATIKGKAIVGLLIGADDSGALWREIHAMKWPGNDTESDYPHLMLDAIAAKYRDKLTTRQVGTSKTTGSVQAPSHVHEAVKLQAAALHEAATMFSNSADAIAHIIRRVS